jgi:hypothetical protein
MPGLTIILCYLKSGNELKGSLPDLIRKRDIEPASPLRRLFVKSPLK